LHGGDAVIETRMSRKKTAAGIAGNSANPGERIDHGFFGITGAPQDIDTVAVSSKLFGASIPARDQLASNWRQDAGGREQLLQSGGEYIQTGAKDLRFGDVPEVFVGNFMGQDTAQLVVIGPAQETRGDIELTVAGVSRIDLGLIDDADSDLIEAAWMIHTL
jgi:hypothetical protein